MKPGPILLIIECHMPLSNAVSVAILNQMGYNRTCANNLTDQTQPTNCPINFRLPRGTITLFTVKYKATSNATLLESTKDI